MNDTTQMETQRILSNGYYRQGTTLGTGGWAHLYHNGVRDWHTYELLDESDEIVEHITAKDDETAIKAFKKLYRLEMFEFFSILERITTFRELDLTSL